MEAGGQSPSLATPFYSTWRGEDMTTIALDITEALANSTATFAEALKLGEADLAAVMAEPWVPETEARMSSPSRTCGTSTPEA